MLLGVCLATAVFSVWLQFFHEPDIPVNNQSEISVIESTVVVQETVIARETGIVEQEITVTVVLPSPTVVLPTLEPSPIPTFVPTEPVVLEPTAVPTQVIQTQDTEPSQNQNNSTQETANAQATEGGFGAEAQTVSFAEPQFAQFIEEQAAVLGLEMSETQATFADGQGTITGSLNTFGLRMGTQIEFSLAAQNGEPELTITNGTIGGQPMPQTIVSQIETAFEQGVKSGLASNSTVYIDSIELENGLMTVTYSQ